MMTRIHADQKRMVADKAIRGYPRIDPRSSASGITLTEVLIASAVAAVVTVGIVAVDVSRTRFQAELRRRSGVLTDVAQTGLAASIQFARSLEAADRVIIVTPNDPADVRLRTFAPTADCGGGCLNPPSGAPAMCCYDTAGNYRWDEYKRTGNELRYYRDLATCTGLSVLSREIGSFSVNFTDATPQAPPGGEPPLNPVGLDTNTFQYTLLWDNGLAGAQRLTHTFGGTVTSRAIPYSDVNATAIDSGTGLAPPGVAGPPAEGCP